MCSVCNATQKSILECWCGSRSRFSDCLLCCSIVVRWIFDAFFSFLQFFFFLFIHFKFIFLWFSFVYGIWQSLSRFQWNQDLHTITKERNKNNNIFFLKTLYSSYVFSGIFSFFFNQQTHKYSKLNFVMLYVRFGSTFIDFCYFVEWNWLRMVE